MKVYYDDECLTNITFWHSLPKYALFKERLYANDGEARSIPVL